MSGNLIIICVTIIICAALLAFCHYQEYHADISDDRYQYLCGQIEGIRKETKSFEQLCDQLQDNMQITDRDIASGFEERDREISQLRSALAPLHQGDGC